MNVWETVVIASYVSLLTLLSVFALHRLRLAMHAGSLFPACTPVRDESSTNEVLTLWPPVLVQLPLYNERFVAERIIDAACRLDYPRERLTIQVLDDSTDDTRRIVAQGVKGWRARGVAIEHVRRDGREGFKAGALAAGLRTNKAPFVAIFDADFVPGPDFLKALLPDLRDPRIGMVQARWGHLNRRDSALAETQAVLLDGHFVNEHGARFARGRFFNFNGTCGIWRRAAIEDAGGWSGRTLTEDLDLSYRAQLRGWRFVYRPDVVVPGELPADAAAFKAQQHRWAKGSIETALLVLPTVWKTPGLPLRTRVEATFHLAANMAYPLLALFALLMPAAMLVRGKDTSLWALCVDALLLLGSTVSVAAFYAMSQRRVSSGARAFWHLPLVLSLGVGLTVNNTRAVFQALRKTRSEFVRTPKDGGAARARSHRYWHRAGGQALSEVAFGVYLSSALGAAFVHGRYAAIPFLCLFAGGFLWLGVASMGIRAAPRRPSDSVAGDRRNVDTGAAAKDNLAVAGGSSRTANMT